MESLKFSEDVVQYLHSWLCTRTGEYRPVAKSTTKFIIKTVVDESGIDHFITNFKHAVNENVFPVATLAFCLSDDYKKALYNWHREVVDNFEKKYKV